MSEYKAHPFMLFHFLKPYLYILLIPTAQGLLSYFLGGSLTSLIVGECLTVAILLGLSIVKLLRFRLYIGEDHIKVTSGVLILSESVVPFDRIATTFVRSDPFLWLAKCVEIRLNTEAGRPGNPDFRMIVHESATVKLRKILSPTDVHTERVSLPAGRLIIMAAVTSSSTTGLLIAAPVVNQVGKLLGEGFTERFYDRITEAVDAAVGVAGNHLGILIPPIAGVIALFLLAGFAVSFLLSIFKNLPMRFERRGDKMMVSAGSLIRRRTGFLMSGVNCVSIIQNPVMMFLRRYNVKVGIAGFGNRRDETSVAIPAAGSDEVYRLTKAILPGVSMDARPEIRPPKKAFPFFCTLPAIFMIAIPVAAMIFSILLPDFSELIWFLAFVAAMFDLVFFMVSVRRFQREGITIGDEFCALGLDWLSFSMVELHCPAEKVGVIRVLRFPADHLSGVCRVKITVRSEGAERINAALLDEKQVAAALRERYGIDIMKADTRRVKRKPKH